MSVRVGLGLIATALIGLPLVGCNGEPGGTTAAAGEGEMCGGIAGIRCEQGLFCKHDIGTCEIADGAGACAVVPEICTDVYDPVCGCDGKTYGNECKADMAAVSIDYQGECR